MPVRALLRELTKGIGFRNEGDFLGAGLGVKLYPAGVFKFLTIGTLISGTAAFCTRWVWNPPSALLLLMFLDLANGRYGYMVAKKIRGEKFSWDEFKRLGGIMISTLIIMGVVRNCINIYPHWEYLADAVFGWLFTTKAKKVVDKMVVLRLQEEGFTKILRNAVGYFLGSKYGPGMVDAMQGRPPAEPGTEAPAEPQPQIPNSNGPDGPTVS